MNVANGNGNGSARIGTSTVKQGLAQMLKGGVIVSIRRDTVGGCLDDGKKYFGPADFMDWI